MNKKRGIPAELSPEENLLYSYGKDITQERLAEMYTKYTAKNLEEMDEEYDLEGLQLIK
jgi:hypothetical protein